jgi:hypothetical protein
LPAVTQPAAPVPSLFRNCWKAENLELIAGFVSFVGAYRGRFQDFLLGDTGAVEGELAAPWLLLRWYQNLASIWHQNGAVLGTNSEIPFS